MSMLHDETKPSITYKDAGVDIDAGNRLVRMIRASVESTRRPEVLTGIGGFGSLFAPDLSTCRNPVLVSTTDGVGTKLKLAFLMEKHDTVGIDLVAMSVNDLLVMGAQPLFFLDYFATGKLDTDIAATVISGIAEGCRQAGCALVGGETAEMPDFYGPNEYDLAGFAVGLVDREQVVTGELIRPGDVVLGLASSGPHSNGYSLIRRVVLGAGGPGLDAPFGDGTLGEALLTPTRIYVKPVLSLLKKVPVHGMVHITGGGFWDNIPRVLPDSCRVAIQHDAWRRPALFDLLQGLGNISDHEMLRTFNCGIGFILVVPREAVREAMEHLMACGETPFRLGEVEHREENGEPVVLR
ncbi:MAG: phosphoribosylformylglycinamidine cyclo-ligase [Magnetococcales bacterium]|nr:phosphoribosylformylglycinamidine cyclo-ligase [Magnetococcales bacterium]